MAKVEFGEAIQDEIASLEAELAKDFRYIRLRELRKLLPLYANSINQEGALGQMAPLQPSPTKPMRQSLRRASSEREKALAVSRDYVSSRGGIVPTRDILAHLTSLGMNVGGSKPLNNLSAIISTSGEFQAHGRSGWTLLEDDSRDHDLMRDAQIELEQEAEAERQART